MKDKPFFPPEAFRGTLLDKRTVNLPEAEVLTHAEMPLPKAILFTDCLQEDFVKLLDAGEGVPNLVHIGPEEALRLLGPHGMLETFLRQAHSVNPSDLMIIHIGDEHDPVKDREHLKRFRDHAKIGEPGSQFVTPIPEFAPGGSSPRPNTFFVRGGNLDDIGDSPLLDGLKGMLEGRDLSNVRVGVVGVWTDVKVQYLAFRLMNELGAKDVATCSSLTASSSIANHFDGLEQLQRVLGVKVHHSPLDFLQWLKHDEPVQYKLPNPGITQLTFKKEVVGSDWSAERVAERDHLIKLVSGAEDLTLSALGGGYSGCQVFKAQSSKGLTVIKVGPRSEIANEHFCNERVGRVLRDVVPSLLGYEEGPTLSVMEMELASSVKLGLEGPDTFQNIGQHKWGLDIDEVLISALKQVVRDGIGRFYHVAEAANADLFTTFSFNDNYGRPSYGPAVARCAEKIAVANGYTDAEEVAKELLADDRWMSPEAFYTEWLPGKTCIRRVYSSPVHGDLNLQNILLSYQGCNAEDVWVIDFARLNRMPVLTDLAKIENDLSYIMLPLESDEDLKRASKLQDYRLASQTLNLDEFETLATTPAEKRYTKLVSTLRQIAAEIDPRGKKACDDYQVALLRYAGHTLSFSEPNQRQLCLAMLGCSRLAYLVKEQVERTMK